MKKRTKFRNLVFLFVAAVILAAWFSKPDYDDFISYQEQMDSNLAGPPVIEYSDGFLFSQIEVTYFQTMDADTQTTSHKNNKIAVPGLKEKYIGLFGKFWSLE